MILVLILVLVDVGLGHQNTFIPKEEKLVLILVLVDVGLGQVVSSADVARECKS